MNRFYWQNAVVLCFGISIAAVGAFLTETGILLRHGAALGIAVFFTIKGASKLRCRVSDILLVGVALFLVVLSKTVPPKTVTPLVFEIGTLAIVLVYPFVGLTYKAIIVNQRSRGRSPKE